MEIHVGPFFTILVQCVLSLTLSLHSKSPPSLPPSPTTFTSTLRHTSPDSCSTSSSGVCDTHEYLMLCCSPGFRLKLVLLFLIHYFMTEQVSKQYVLLVRKCCTSTVLNGKAFELSCWKISDTYIQSSLNFLYSSFAVCGKNFDLVMT